MVVLRVVINPGEVRQFGTVHARLFDGSPDLPASANVRIRLPDPAMGTNCIYLGPTDGPVFVAGRV